MKKLRFLVLVTCTTVSHLGCDSGGGDSSDRSDGSTSHGDQEAGSDPQHDAGVSAGSCSGCGVSEGCVGIDVSVIADSADLPWKTWPDQASGAGRLFAGVYGAGTPASVKYEDDVNLKTMTTKKSFEVCAAPGSVSAFCFLDDSRDGSVQSASGTLRGSSNYLDTCSTQRQITATVTVGARASVVCSLSVSCD